MRGGGLSLYVVYDHPVDLPEHFVVRRHASFPGISRPTRDVWTFDQLEEARLFLAKLGLFRLKRDDDDDPKIIETWL